MVLAEILNSLRNMHQLPAKIDLAMVGKRFWCVIDESKEQETEKPNSIINESVFTGMSFIKETAVLKALSERAERQAFLSGAKCGFVSCLTPRSDGFAALPISLQSQMNVRDSALNEAIERFAWATWWDNVNSTFDLKDLPELPLSLENEIFVRQTLESLNVENLKIVSPKLGSYYDKKVLILIGKLRGKGYISGGACGENEDVENVFFRAFDEFYRHGSALKRAQELEIKPVSFYEKRLIFFGLGSGDHLVTSRLSRRGKTVIDLPNLSIDECIPSKFSDFIVHRCYFENQPLFVGGPIERFCL